MHDASERSIFRPHFLVPSSGLPGLWTRHPTGAVVTDCHVIAVPVLLTPNAAIRFSIALAHACGRSNEVRLEGRVLMVVGSRDESETIRCGFFKMVATGQ